MTITFDLKLATLRAMRRFASTDGERLTLNGVLIEVGPAGNIVMTATDGRRLGSYATHGTQSFTPEAWFTIPNELIDAIPINMKTLRLPMQVDYNEQVGIIRIHPSCDDLEIRMRAIAEVFPRWRSVVPDPWPETFEARFLSANMKYLSDFFEAASELIGHDQLVMSGGGIFHQPIAVRGCGKNGEGEFFGLLMPVHQPDGEGLGELPLWVKP